MDHRKEMSGNCTEKILTLHTYKTACMYIGMISIGFVASITGPTFVHLEYILHSDTQGIGLSSIGLNIGYLLGSILCGLIFHRFHQELQLALSAIWIGVTTGSLPFQPDVYWFYGLTTIQNIGMGFSYSSAQYYILHLWLDHSLQKPFVQALHAFWSLGSFTIPFILIPFLPDLPMDDNISTNLTANDVKFNDNMTYSGNEMLIFNTTINQNDLHKDKDVKHTLSDHDIMLVKYGYIIVGAVSIFAGVLFLSSAVLGKFACKTKEARKLTNLEKDIHSHENIALRSHSDLSENKEEAVEKKEIKNMSNSSFIRCLKYTMLVLLFTYTFFYFWQDYVVGYFLSAIAIHGLRWKVTQAAILNSIYRGTQGLGRIIGIFISAVISPGKMLLINMTSTCLSLLGFILSVLFTTSDIPVWVSVAGIGLSLSTTLPAMYLWGTQYVEATAAYGGMYFAAASVGSIVGGSLGSYLFQHYGYMWIMYNALGSAVVVFILFFIATLTGKKILIMKKQFIDTEGKLEN